jgi:hypothetical protein
VFAKQLGGFLHCIAAMDFDEVVVGVALLLYHFHDSPPAAFDGLFLSD